MKYITILCLGIMLGVISFIIGLMIHQNSVFLTKSKAPDDIMLYLPHAGENFSISVNPDDCIEAKSLLEYCVNKTIIAASSNDTSAAFVFDDRSMLVLILRESDNKLVGKFIYLDNLE